MLARMSEATSGSARVETFPDIASLIRATALRLRSNRWIKFADEHDRQNGRKQRQQSFVPWAHDKITPAGTLGFQSTQDAHDALPPIYAGSQLSKACASALIC